MSATNFAPFIRRLTKLGFRVHWDTRSKFNGREAEYIREQDGRRVGVQLWSGGVYRAFHSINECSDTRPTEFSDIAGMERAIEREQARMDSGYALRLVRS